MLDAVPDDVPLVWVDTYYRDQFEGAAFVNTVVADRLARRGNAVMARWSDVAAGDGVVQRRRRAPDRRRSARVRRRRRARSRRVPRPLTSPTIVCVRISDDQADENADANGDLR